MIAPSTAVPIVPPTCMAVDCRPPDPGVHRAQPVHVLQGERHEEHRPEQREHQHQDQHRVDALLNALAARPPAEDPLTALRRAFRASLGAITGDQDRPSYLTVLELIESTPTLLAAHLRYFHDHDQALVSALAGREGVDPDADPRPRILAALFSSVVSPAIRDWRAAGAGDSEAVLAAFDVYADRLGPGLFGHWRTAG